MCLFLTHINVCIPPLFLCKPPSIQAHFAFFYAISAECWILILQGWSFSASCWGHIMRRALFFLCFLFSLPSTSSSPHLHLPNPSLSNVHLAEECVTLQSYTICSQSACCGHARLCICKHFSTQVHRRGVWACDHICEVLYRIFPARLRYRVNTRSILCACNFFDECWKMGHRSITASLCWSAGRQHVLPRDLTEPDNQTNPIHSVSFWHLCLCSDLVFFCFFLPSFVSHWVQQRLEAYIAHNWNHGTNLHS